MSVQNKLNEQKYPGDTECKCEHDDDYCSSSSSSSSDDECCGPPGPRGPRGKKGPKGDRGCRGHRGHRGPTGYTGYTGFTGPMGPQGEQGPQGEIGPTGWQGELGPTGPTGWIGPIGPTGSTGPHYICETYLNIYNLTHYSVLPEAPLIFDSHRTIAGNIGHILNTGEIYVWEAGVYFVHFELFHLEPAQFGLFLNDVYYSDSVETNQSSATILSSSLLVRVTDADLIPTDSPFGIAAKIQIRNHTSFPPLGVTLNGHAGTGYMVSPNSSMIMFLLGKL
jgi:hypothetical protein